MLSSSSSRYGDVADTYVDFFKSFDQKHQKQRLEAEVRTLKRTLQTLRAKEQRLIKRLEDQTSKPGKRRRVSEDDDDDSVLFEAQKMMELFKLCHSVTGLKHQAGSGKLVFKFHPISSGKLFGPYQVWAQASINLRALLDLANSIVNPIRDHFKIACS